MNVAGSLQAVRDWIHTHFYTRQEIDLLFINAGLGNMIKPDKIVYEDEIPAINPGFCMISIDEEIDAEAS